jgi:uncharacterized protein (DUF1810 family)
MKGTNDSFNLQRFLDAQDRVVDAVNRELQDGSKRSHWMWFVFPQIRGLGHSSTAQHYAIGSLEEAEAYLSHPTLGSRLVDWTKMVREVEGRSAEQIFGYPDYLKFRSCMTLFSRVPGAPSVFQEALDTYYDGKPDQATLRILGTG